MTNTRRSLNIVKVGTLHFASEEDKNKYLLSEQEFTQSQLLVNLGQMAQASQFSALEEELLKYEAQGRKLHYHLWVDGLIPIEVIAGPPELHP